MINSVGLQVSSLMDGPYIPLQRQPQRLQDSGTLYQLPAKINPALSDNRVLPAGRRWSQSNTVYPGFLSSTDLHHRSVRSARSVITSREGESDAMSPRECVEDRLVDVEKPNEVPTR